MAYSTYTTIIPLFPDLPQATGTSGWDDTKTMFSQAIAKADSVINMKIARRYDVSSWTYTTAPPDIKNVSVDLACYYYWTYAYSGDNQNVSEWAEVFEKNLDLLDEIRGGKMDLISTSGSLVPERDIADGVIMSSNNENYTPVFDVGDELKWNVDTDLIDSINGTK